MGMCCMKTSADGTSRISSGCPMAGPWSISGNVASKKAGCLSHTLRDISCLSTVIAMTVEMTAVQNEAIVAFGSFGIRRFL